MSSRSPIAIGDAAGSCLAARLATSGIEHGATAREAACGAPWRATARVAAPSVAETPPWPSVASGGPIPGISLWRGCGAPRASCSLPGGKAKTDPEAGKRQAPRQTARKQARTRLEERQSARSTPFRRGFDPIRLESTPIRPPFPVVCAACTPPGMGVCHLGDRCHRRVTGPPPDLSDPSGSVGPDSLRICRAGFRVTGAEIPRRAGDGHPSGSHTPLQISQA